jgi:hypothetical protein
VPSRLDHLVVAVPDLERAASAWTAAGLPAVRGGAHPVGTVNALVRGPEPAYVELIAAGSRESNAWLDRVRAEHGPISWAVAVDDVDEARTALLAAGFEPQPVRDGSRTTPDGEVVAWRTCDVGPGPYDGALPFLIQWTTPMPAGPADGPVVAHVELAPPDPDRVADLLLALGFSGIRHWPRRVFEEPGRPGPRITLQPVDEPDGRASWTMQRDEGALPAVSVALSVPREGVVTTDLDGVRVTTIPDRRRFPAAALVPAVDDAAARLGAQGDEVVGARADAWVEAVVAAGIGRVTSPEPDAVAWARHPHVSEERLVVLRGRTGTQPVTVARGRVAGIGPSVVVGVGEPVEVLQRWVAGSIVTPVEALADLDDAFVLALAGGVYAVRDGERAVIRSLDGHGSTGLEPGEGKQWLADADAGRRTDGVLRGDPWL